MHGRTRVEVVLLGLIAAAGGACGDSGTGPEPGAPLPNEISLQSDPGDYIGGGQSYTYTQANALLDVDADGGKFSIVVEGDELWAGNFQSPSGINQLQPGTYSNLQRYPFHDPAKGGLSWSGDGRGCNTLSGWFAVDSVTYTGTELTSILLRFEQHCEGSAPALHGTIRWRFDDPTTAPGPTSTSTAKQGTTSVPV